MKKSIACIASLLLTVSLPAFAGQFNVVKAALMVPVVSVSGGVKTVTRTLTAKEFINLTLGQPLDTPLGTKILALMLDYEYETTPGQPPPTPHTKLVVWDTAAAGDFFGDKTVATVGPLSELDYDYYETGSAAKGEGVATATIADGSVADNKFFATTLHGAGQVSQPISFSPVVIKSNTLKLTGLCGRIHFKYTKVKDPTVVEVQGFALKGSLTTAGGPIAHFAK